MRDWQDERWIKLYTRDEPEWLVLPWWVRGLFDEIMKRLDPAGVMRLGKAGRKAIAASLSASWDNQLAEAIQALVDDGAIQLLENETVLFVPNFVAAQEAKQSDKARQQKRRERARAMDGVTPRDATVTGPFSGAGGGGNDSTTSVTTQHSNIVTPRDANSTPRDARVTPCDASVTPGHTASRREEKRREEIYDPTDRCDADAPTQPSSSERVQGQPEPLTLRPDQPRPKRQTQQRLKSHSLPQATGWAIWREMYRSSCRGYGEYFDAPEDGRHMAELVRHAQRLASEELTRRGESAQDLAAVERLAKELLVHWFREYLRDDGSEKFSLPARKHMLRWLSHAIPTYGAPPEWGTAAGAQLSPREQKARLQALVSNVGRMPQ